MYKIILSAALTLTTVNAWAGWTSAGETEEVNEYIDLTSLKRSGNLVKMWTMHDYKQPYEISGGPSFSTLQDFDEYDCKEELVRTLSRVILSGNMGKGKVIASLNDSSQFGGWKSMPPGSIGQSILKIACNKK